MDESGWALARRGVRGEKTRPRHVSLGAIGAFRRGNAKCGEKQEQCTDVSRETSQVGLKTPPLSRARQLFFLFSLHRFTGVSQIVVYEKLVCEHEGDFYFTLTFTRCEPPDGVSKRGVFDELSCVKLGEGTLKVRESLSSPTTFCQSVGCNSLAVSPKKAYLHP